MKRNKYFQDTSVVKFIDWLSVNLPILKICLRIGKSRFVPVPIRANICGIQNVLPHYVWKSSGMRTGNWPQTNILLATLSNQLRRAVRNKNDPQTLKACKEILDWGGNRNWKVGAWTFLNRGVPSVHKYIKDAGQSFVLAKADEARTAVIKMNSMLTKVHALYAKDGLPIYDSRVAAAIASLVEMWRVSTHQASSPLPDRLSFPATMLTRSVHRLFPGARGPGVINYASPNTPAKWASAKIRLGWIMEKVLGNCNDLFPGSPISSRMRQFEASLFMIGYDVACLDCRLKGRPPSSYSKVFDGLSEPYGPRTGVTKTIRPLSNRGKDMRYSGDLERGVTVHWGRISMTIDPEFFADVQSEFGGRKNVPLGASRTGKVSKASLGHWIVSEEKWPSRQHVSCIAPILCDLGIARAVRHGRAISLDFPEPDR